MNHISPYNFYPKGQAPHFTDNLKQDWLNERMQKSVYELTDQHHHLDVKFYNDHSLKAFYDFGLEQKQAALVKMENYGHFLNQMKIEEVDLNDNKQTLQAILKKMGLKLSDDFFSVLSDEDVLEVYDNSFIQVHRNLNCLKLTSYDVLTLCSYDWPHLFTRDQRVNESLIFEAATLLGEVLPLYESKVEKHLMIERASSEKRQMMIKNKFGATLTNENGHIVGFAATQEAKLIDHQKSGIEFLRSH